jgi:uncharacterized protein (DUF2336 family)
MTAAAQPILAELDTALNQATDSWRSTTLRRITDLFLTDTALYSAEQVALFDDVICRLIPKMDRAVLAELSNKLASVDNAPLNAIGKLARHLDIAISGPILEHAKALPDKDMVEIADKDKIDQKLLMKIASRPQLDAAVTDILVARGNRTIQRKLIDNPQAGLSEASFARLIMGVEGDKVLAAAIAARQDLPAGLQLWLDGTLNA